MYAADRVSAVRCADYHRFAVHFFHRVFERRITDVEAGNDVAAAFTADDTAFTAEWSSDNTNKEIFKIKDKRIRYIKIRKNRGANFCRNLGIKKSTGEYISFLDSDDIYSFNKLEKQIKNIKRNKSNFDFCKIRININIKNNIFSFTVPNSTRERNILNGKILDELCKCNFISTQSMLMNRKILEKYLFDIKMPRLQDYDLILRIIPKVKISYTKEVLADLYTKR